MLEWWQWYQPYYTFPLQVKNFKNLRYVLDFTQPFDQVKISIRNQTTSRRIPTPTEFVKFLKTDESLHR